MHDQNIVHRDLSLDNIMIEKEEGFDSIKLIDFGHSLHMGEEIPDE